MIKGTKIRLSLLTAAEKWERSMKLEKISENGRHFSEKDIWSICCEAGHKEITNIQMRDACGPVLISILPL